MATKKIAVAPKKESPQKALPNILMRIVAVFAASGLSVLGTVVERLARAFLDDGKLTIAEINDAFKTVDKKAN